MPRENDALRGETKTFDVRCAALSLAQSASEKAFAESMILCSAGVRSRGRAVSAVGGPSLGEIAGSWESIFRSCVPMLPSTWIGRFAVIRIYPPRRPSGIIAANCAAGDRDTRDVPALVASE